MSFRRFVPILIVGLAFGAQAFGQERAIGPDVKVHAGLGAKYLSKPRDVLVLLPPAYESERGRRYPVLYLHDGSNVYIEWRIDETAKRLVEAREIEPVIIVLVPNGGTTQDRLEDYTPTRPASPPNARFGGKADAYGRFLVEELKPLIDRQYRTAKDAANTGLGGASLGGLVTLYLGLEHPDVFGKLAVMSPSVWWDDELIVRKVKKLKARTTARIWLDAGELEGTMTRDDVKELRDALVKKGWTLGTDLAHYEAPGAKHGDVEFGRRADRMLKFLFPPK